MVRTILQTFVNVTAILRSVPPRDVPIGGGGASPVFSNLQESWSKGSHAGRELATVFSVMFFSF